MTLTKLCPDCKGNIGILEDNNEYCKLCKGDGRISVEISAGEIIKYFQDNQSELFISKEEFDKFVRERDDKTKSILRNICKHKNISTKDCQVCEAYFQLFELQLIEEKGK